QHADHIAITSGSNRDQSVLVAILGDLPGLFCSGLAGFTRFDEFDCSHCAESANIADKIKSARPIFYATIKVLPDRLRARQKISALKHAERRTGGPARQRSAGH